MLSPRSELKKYQYPKKRMSYDGQVIRRSPIKTRSGAIYTGEWLDQKMEGNGVMKWPDQS